MNLSFQRTNENNAVAKEAERIRALEEEVMRLRILVEAAFEGIGVMQNGLVFQVNEQLAKMLGYERAEMIGVPVMNFVAPESRDAVRRSIAANRPESYEHLALRKDGTIFPVEVRGRTIGKAEDRTRATVLRDITAQREAEDRLKTLTQRLKLATAAAAIAVWDWDLSTNTAACDERLFEIYGLPDTANGMTFEQWTKLVHPEDLPGQKAALQRTIQEKGHGFREFRIIRPDGALRHIQSAEAVITDDRGAPVRVVGMNVDITERKQAEVALRESEERFRAVVEFSPIAICVAVDERLVYVNPAGAKLIGATEPGAAEKLIGRSVYDFIPPALQETARERRAKVLQGQPAPPFEGSLLHFDGSTTIVELYVFPFVYAGRPAILNLIQDITARKRAEKERAEALAREHEGQLQFTRQLITSQEAERARIAAELHDSLGQTLLLIKNRVQLALEGTGGTPAGASAQLGAIRALATQAIFEVRQIAHALHPYQLNHLGLTAALGAMIDSASDSSGIHFERKLDPVDEVFTKDAATNLYRVVQESLNNVLNHSKARRARVELERDVREVVLRVEDDGLGFEGEPDGGGIGLQNISKRVQLLGGKLTVDSSLERGTRVEVTIPIADVQ